MESERQPLHVHVGAGKLASGLLVPAMAESSVPFVVLQAPREGDPWNPVFEAASSTPSRVGLVHVEVEHRDERITVALLVVNAEADVTAADIAAMAAEVQTRGGVCGLFVVSPCIDDLWLPLLSCATSISTAVGPSLVPWLGRQVLLQLPPRRHQGSSAPTDSRGPAGAAKENTAAVSVEEEEGGDDSSDTSDTSPPRLFACENDADAIEELRQLLVGRADVVTCVIDKVCSGLDVGSCEGGAEEVEEQSEKQKQQSEEEKESEPLCLAAAGSAAAAAAAVSASILVSASKSPTSLTSSALSASSASASVSDFRWTARVSTEPYAGMILPLTAVAEGDALFPFAGAAVRTVQDEAAAEFLHQKKLVQVNGTHTALAFTTLCEAAIKDFEGNLAVDIHQLPLRPIEDMSAAHKEQMWDWAVCEALELLLDYDLEVVKRAYRADDDAALVCLILDDARAALNRLSESAEQDTVGRVLNAGVMVRLEGRLRTVNDKLQREIEAGGEHLRDAHRLLLAEAGVKGGIEELGEACDALFSQCARVAKFVDESI